MSLQTGSNYLLFGLTPVLYHAVATLKLLSLKAQILTLVILENRAVVMTLTVFESFQMFLLYSSTMTSWGHDGHSCVTPLSGFICSRQNVTGSVTITVIWCCHWTHHEECWTKYINNLRTEYILSRCTCVSFFKL